MVIWAELTIDYVKLPLEITFQICVTTLPLLLPHALLSFFEIANKPKLRHFITELATDLLN